MKVDKSFNFSVTFCQASIVAIGESLRIRSIFAIEAGIFPAVRSRLRGDARPSVRCAFDSVALDKTWNRRSKIGSIRREGDRIDFESQQ